MRRRALIAAATAAFPVTAGAWQPPRPMRILVPLAPGGTADTIARIVADPMAATLGQPVLIENRPGGNGSVAAISVARGPADGLTLLYCSPSIQILNPLMMRNIPYDAMADFTPVVALMRAPKVLVVRPDFPAHSVAELIALAKSRPGGLTYASAGIGSSAHLAGALFAQMAGIEMLHIPYRGTAPGVQDLMGGRVDMILDTAAALLPLVREGRLRALAVSTQDRAAAAPDLPPIAATLPGFSDASFNYLIAAARTPPDAIAAINEAANHALADPSVRARFAALGAEPLGGTPAQLAAAVQEEIARWRGVIASQGITIE
ncbi:Bug family tripartite tricarboxylate transporter substrate binding protein [Neoroseomonas oryzicola]|uniref:Tripartite tricarboxylate transporter substrate binding protein n=1 Tax=Neoroseomonas oryzicola TaxID=535904 RepID=A0A9X9WKG4_9PROT|nr:tripartite tricarboxylate transporter substrate-binding protein [Neoroseomonas oryzicola]MBR0660824.1 tripartite tricarboxylate transporter substrate binding protein [Neoroseomonas oryzicola]NKE19607.1 tripartite tricarboxylate transporter substrate binding protein [Neoroseomonas oryzicola]